MNMGVFVAAVISALGLPAAYAFEVDAPPLGGVAVHEAITRDAVTSVSSGWGLSPAATAVTAVVAGAVNPDSQLTPHKVGADLNDYHLNNAHMDNGQFDRSFRLIRDLVAQAVQLSRGNPRVLNPQGVDFSRFANALTRGCRAEQALCTVFGGIVALPGVLSLRHTADPHTAGAPLELLRRALPAISAQAPAAVRGSLNQLQQELNAYAARQFMGHAFHVLQDFFAHSNFVELLNNRRGPPCGRARPTATNICGAVVQGRPLRFNDPRADDVLQALARGFDLRVATFGNALAPAQRNRLQTGFVSLAAGLINMCPDLMGLPNGFDYCHWSSGKHPALNKDKPGNGEASHGSHAYAFELALFASEIMWEHFLRASGLAPAVRVSVAGLTLSEPVGRMPAGRMGPSLTFTLPRPLLTETTFDVTLAANGSARGGSRCRRGVDFVTRRRTLAVGRGATSVQLPVTVCNDNAVESNERLLAVLRTRQAAQPIVNAQHIVTINDNDRHPPPVLDRVRVLTAAKVVRTAKTQLELSGRNFQRSSYAELNGERLPVSFKGPTLMHATLPQGMAAGRQSVRVVTPRGGQSAYRQVTVAGLVNKVKRK